MAKPKRPRTEVREQERERRKTVRALEKLARSGPGGAPDRAIVVPTVAVIETKARATPCLQCGGELQLREHEAEVQGSVQLRLVRLVCLRCQTPREIWFRVERPLAN